MQIEHFQIADRFCGPPRSGNGGYTCGRIAKHLPGAVSVRLKAPPPLQVDLRLESSDTEAQLFHESKLIGQAQLAELDLQIPTCPTFVQAQASSKLFSGFKLHSFPSCFVCGPERLQEDGLRIFPGLLENSTTIAATWVPSASLSDEAGNIKPEFLWSALDCTGAFTIAALPEALTTVLGELTVFIVDTLKLGEQCVVIGWPLGSQGCKHLAGTAIYAPDNRLVAFSRAVWMEVSSTVWS